MCQVHAPRGPQREQLRDGLPPAVGRAGQPGHLREPPGVVPDAARLRRVPLDEPAHAGALHPDRGGAPAQATAQN